MELVFDLAPLIEEFGEGTALLLHKRKGERQPYPVAAEREEDKLIWRVSSADTAVRGVGEAELQWYAGETLKKSVTMLTVVEKALEKADENPPDPVKPWYDKLMEAVNEAKGDPEAIQKAVTAYLEEHPVAGAVSSVNGETGDVKLTAGDVDAYTKSEADAKFALKSSGPGDGGGEGGGSEIIDATPESFTQGRINKTVVAGSKMAFESASTWYYTSVDVTGSTKAEVKFRATSNWTNYIVGVDKDEIVKKVYTSSDDANAEITKDCEITSDIVKLYICSYALNTYAGFYVKKYTLAKENLSDRIAEIESDVALLKDAANEIDAVKAAVGSVRMADTIIDIGNPVNGRVNGSVGANVAFGTETYWEHYSVDVGEGDHFLVKAYSSASSFKNYVVFTNAAGKILSIPTESHAVVESFTASCEAPQGAAKMYITSNPTVNVQNAVSVTKKNAEFVDLQTQINEIAPFKLEIMTMADFNTAVFDCVNYLTPIVLL